MSNSPESIAQEYYALLRREIIDGNPYLDNQEQSILQKFYPVMMNSKRYAVKSVSDIYVNRRSHAVQAILKTDTPIVFDAGCGFGSESFLFASSGAKVLSVDRSSDQIAIAKKRQHYYEEIFGKELDISFVIADLEEYVPDTNNISLTWLASVLAAIRDQNDFLKRIYKATREGGKVIITDMNLLNPAFLWNEWRRRKECQRLIVRNLPGMQTSGRCSGEKTGLVRGILCATEEDILMMCNFFQSIPYQGF